MTKGLLRLLRRNTIALLALFLALGGTTYAASTALIGKNTVASPQVVNGSLQTKDLSAKARRALKGNRGLRGLTGAPGAKGATGAQGIQGIQGTQGVPGTARAYAYVTGGASPTLDANRTKNIVSVSNAGIAPGGVYCLKPAAGIDRNTTPAVVEMDWSVSAAALRAYYHPGFNCAADEFEVIVADGAGTRTNAGSFVIVVP
jgi:hypothetical protein